MQHAIRSLQNWAEPFVARRKKETRNNKSVAEWERYEGGETLFSWQKCHHVVEFFQASFSRLPDNRTVKMKALE